MWLWWGHFFSVPRFVANLELLERSQPRDTFDRRVIAMLERELLQRRCHSTPKIQFGKTKTERDLR